MPAVLELTLLARNAPEQDLEAICIAVVLMANGEGVFRYQFAGAFFVHHESLFCHRTECPS